MKCIVGAFPNVEKFCSQTARPETTSFKPYGDRTRDTQGSNRLLNHHANSAVKLLEHWRDEKLQYSRFYLLALSTVNEAQNKLNTINILDNIVTESYITTCTKYQPT